MFMSVMFVEAFIIRYELYTKAIHKEKVKNDGIDINKNAFMILAAFPRGYHPKPTNWQP